MDNKVLLLFIQDSPVFKTEKPYSVVRTKELPDDESTNIDHEEHDISQVLEDIRDRKSDFTLEKDAICWVDHSTEVEITTEEDMMIPYAKETNNLIRKLLNTDDVICYDLRWRRNASFTDEEAFSNSRNVPSPPVRNVHIDHTPEGGWNRIRRHLSPEETEKFCNGQYRARIVNVWRPLFRPIEDNPIAFCDPDTVCRNDMLEVDRVTPISLIEVFQIKFNPTQRWRWLSKQTPDEPVVFVQFDSHPRNGRINGVPHATFNNPTAGPDCIPRESVETRSIVFTRL
ncbi:hypothetical protein B0T16DRAFT_402684 [Cercophora newfieldiana]|uniref:Uncharacterized protein n=1 Tax=Cercophora newfieldiana TaxID=92897 RepID=A0AA40D000_9PEZI|nr:hypothetical protein B0T16DRAFT_402684 [Cercophora newfieldiana]